MRIAILAHVRQPIRQPFLGGMESYTWSLVEGLGARGHDVTLFASGDSDPRFRIDAVLDEHYERVFPWAEHRGRPALIAHVDKGYGAACARIAAGGYDVVHNNSLHRFPLAAPVPTVTSLHVPPYEALHGFVAQSVRPGHHVTVTSARQLDAWWPQGAPEGVSVLHNAVDMTSWPWCEQGDGTAVWCGRITPNKGPHLAIAAARRAGVPITLYGAIEDPGYYRAQVEPLLGGDARYAGHLCGAALPGAVGRASVFLFTPCWDEPFGLVAIEAMACGVPVAAIDMGAAREVVGDSGVVVPAGDGDALAAAIRRAMAIPRTLPRARVAAHFSREIWLDRCEALYATVCN